MTQPVSTLGVGRTGAAAREIRQARGGGPRPAQAQGGGGAPLRCVVAGSGVRGRRSRPDRAHPGRAAGQDPLGGEKHRQGPRQLAPGRRSPQPRRRREGGGAGQGRRGRGADEGQPAHRRADGRRGRPRGRPAHGAAGQPLLRHGRARPSRRAHHHRRGGQHRADAWPTRWTSCRTPSTWRGR